MKNIKVNWVYMTAFYFFVVSTVVAQHLKPVTKSGKKVGNATRSAVLALPCRGWADPAAKAHPGWMANLKNLGVTHKGPEYERWQSVIEQKTAIKIAAVGQYRIGADINSERSFFSIDSPKVGYNFEGNVPNGMTPADNSIAISNAGRIISVANTSIVFDTVNGMGRKYSTSLNSLVNDPNFSQYTMYDPRVIYDSDADRFIVVCLYGSMDTVSKIICLFSKTNDPFEGFWKYYLPGNVISACWFDYPSIGVSINELYISGNTYYNAGLFNQAVVFQIDKNACYAGSTLNYIWWGSIQTGNLTFASTVKPVSWGHQGNYGPGCYLISHDNSVYAEVELHEITADLNQNPQFITYGILTQPWSPAGNAIQQGTNTLLHVGDTRIQNAFYLDSTIHFVFSYDWGSGHSGISYNRLNIFTQTISTASLGSMNSDYCYPSVVSYSTSGTDHTAMICFLKSDYLHYPEIRVVQCDNSMTWSFSALVKSGVNYVNYLAGLSGGVARWGDYTGIVRKHNGQVPEIWLNGSYGRADSTWGTWIAQVGGTPQLSALSSNPVPVEREALKVYPNPVMDIMHVAFTLKEKGHIKISIINTTGQLVNLLYDQTAEAGRHLLAFNKNALPTGTYLVSVQADHEIIQSEKIVVIK